MSADRTSWAYSLNRILASARDSASSVAGSFQNCSESFRKARFLPLYSWRSALHSMQSIQVKEYPRFRYLKRCQVRASAWTAVGPLSLLILEKSSQADHGA